MKIGITERGDAGIDLSWVDKMNTVDGAILITKNITEDFKQAVLSLDKPVIVHCTCTGFGGTELEPNVPDYKTQLESLKDLISRGFPGERCVLRIDPIFPTPKGLEKMHAVQTYFGQLLLHDEVTRIRVSVVDEYKHVKERFKEKGWPCLYSGFQASDKQLNDVIEELAKYPQRYETCAENRLYELTYDKDHYPYLFEKTGCISKKDLELMGLSYEETDINPQGRSGCHCLGCKTELLTNKKQCPNGCVYCFWH